MKRFALVLVLCFAFQICVSASEFLEPKLSVSSDYSSINVSGNAPEGCEQINMLLMLPGNTDSSIQDGYAGNSIADAISLTDVEGEYNVTFKAQERFIGGEYILYTTAVTKDGIVEYATPFTYNGVDFFSAMVSRFNDATENNIAELIGSYKTVIFGDDQEAYTYFENNKNTVFSTFLCSKPYSKISDIQNAAFSDYISSLLRSTQSETDFCAILEKDSKVYGITEDEYYADLKAQITKYMFDSREKISNIVALKSLYNEAIMLSRFNNASRDEVDGLLNEYKTILGIELGTKYANEKRNVAVAICNSIPYDSVSALVSVLNSSLLEKSPSYSGGGAVTVVPNRSSGGTGGGTVPYVYQEDLIENTKNPFCDLDCVEWARDSINRLFEAGIVNGVDGQHFNPEKPVLREEFAKLVSLAFDIKADSYEMKFNDVNVNEWYAPFIAAMVKNGVVLGKTDETFGTGENISRQDAAVIMARAAKLINIDFKAVCNTPMFTDSIEDYAFDSVSLLYQLGVINGTSDTTFEGHAVLTRAQSAKMIDMLRQLYMKGAHYLEK